MPLWLQRLTKCCEAEFAGADAIDPMKVPGGRPEMLLAAVSMTPSRTTT